MLFCTSHPEHIYRRLLFFCLDWVCWRLGKGSRKAHYIYWFNVAASNHNLGNSLALVINSLLKIPFLAVFLCSIRIMVLNQIILY